HLVVMYRGHVVESGPALELLQHPQHPYTQRLIAAAPSLASRRLVSGQARAEIRREAEGAARDQLEDDAAGEGTSATGPAAETHDDGDDVIVVENLTKVYGCCGCWSSSS